MTVAAKERPILFKAEMVNAILAGRKSQTRRIVKGAPSEASAYLLGVHQGIWGIHADVEVSGGVWRGKCPYGRGGDRLWVRETFAIECNRGYDYEGPDDPLGPVQWHSDDDEGKWFKCPRYRASEPDTLLCIAHCEDDEDSMRWTPSIFMPRWASRITLEATDVRVQRLQEISEEDAVAEGCQCAGVPASLTNRGAYAKLWESINGPGSWDANPWVWAVSFERLEPKR